MTALSNKSRDQPGDPFHQGPLPRSAIFAYCLPTLGMGLLFMPLSIWLFKFSTDVLLIAPAAMGTILFVGRFWDAISDPVAGYLSDRSTARAGRRRSWMMAFAIPLGVSTILVWSPPWFIDGAVLVVWVAVALVIYETAATGVLVPYGALGMELTDQYHERTRLFGFRHVAMAMGSILGLGAVFLMRTGDDPRLTAFVVSTITGVIVATTVLLAAKRLPERSDYRGRGAIDIRKSFTDVLRNPHGRLLFIVYGVETFGAASIAMLAPYIMQYVVHAPDLNEVFILTYFVPQFALTPIWIRLAKRFSKKNLWLFSMMCLAVGYCSIFFVGEGSFTLLFVIIFLLGLGGGCGSVIAPSIQADVIDYDEYLTGERKEGAYTAIWNFIRKAAGGISAIITGWALQYAGYVPNAEDQSERVITVLLALIGLLPAFCYAIGTVLFFRFSLNEAEHDRIVRELRERATASSES
ncbi:MAG: MFS transporter [Myxococcales bacterium]|nr:MFS transporter [Myxococcales bacterium]